MVVARICRNHGWQLSTANSTNAIAYNVVAWQQKYIDGGLVDFFKSFVM